MDIIQISGLVFALGGSIAIILVLVDTNNKCNEYFGNEWTCPRPIYSCDCMRTIVKEMCIEGTNECKNVSTVECKNFEWVDKK